MKNILSVLIIIFFAVISCKEKDNNFKVNFESKPVQIKGSVGNLSAILQTPDLPENEKCPIVIIMHGITSFKERPIFIMLADKLQSEGIASIRFDFNGHGESEGEFIDMTVPKEIGDARAVYEYAKSLNFVNGISLLGHSQGGVVASMFGGELKNNIQSIVLMAPAGIIEDASKGGVILGQTFNTNNIPEYIEFNNHKIGSDYIKTAQTLNIYETAAQYEGPVCIIHGTMDELVPYNYGEKYRDIYKNGTLYPIEGENHSFSKDMELATDIAVDFIKSIVKK